MHDILEFGWRLLDAGYIVDLDLNGSKPMLHVRYGWRRKLAVRKRVGWVPRRACVGVIPKRNRRLFIK